MPPPISRSASADSIGADLGRRRLEYRAARLSAALARLRRVADEGVAAGREVPRALRAAERTFADELEQIHRELAALPPPRDAAAPDEPEAATG
jgi:hypothetical protein